jgi:hypothetical protein
MTTTVPIASITRYRETIQEIQGAGFVALLTAGGRLPLLEVKHFNDSYLIHNGSHRLRAAALAGHTMIEVELIDAPAEVPGIRVLTRSGQT